MWLHSSVGRASHRYRRGHGFESRWSPEFFQASLFQFLKLEIHCDDYLSLSYMIRSPLRLAMPCWRVLTRTKQLSMAATPRVIGCTHGYSLKFRVCVCREGSYTLTLFKGEENENWYPFYKAQTQKLTTYLRKKKKCALSKDNTGSVNCAILVKSIKLGTLIVFDEVINFR